MRKISLRNRILLYFLVVPFFVFVIAGFLTIIDMYELQNFAAATGTDITNEATHESIHVLEKEVNIELQMLADGQAIICELQMRRALAGMNDLISLYRDIWNGNYRVGDRGFVAGDTFTHRFRDDFINVSYPARLSQDEIKSGLEKLTMMRNAFKYSCAYNDYYAGMGIALPNGLFFKYDWFPVSPDYDAQKTMWFKSAMSQKGEVVWFEPALSSTSNKLLLTCSQAVVINGKIEAVIVIDILPQTISKEFVVTRGTDCFAFLISPLGEVVAREDIVSKKLIWDLSPEEKKEFKNAITRKITTGKKTIFSAVLKGERLNVAFSPMSPGAWGVGVALPVKNIHVNVENALGEIKIREKSYISSMMRYIDRKILIYLGICLVVSLIMLFFAAWTARRIGKPIMQLEAGVELLGRRELNEKITLKSNDEFQELGDTFNAMASELNEQIKRLKKNIARQERAKHELLVSAEIQQAMLPDVSMAFPDHDEFDIYAEMHPAKEVGGDFYDFFFVDEKHLFFAIGDVSGKGLSAALFMMRSLTLLRHEAEDGLAPDEILINVGNELEQNNDPCMFFTGTCGIINVANGEVVLSNGGHPLPYLRHENRFEPVETENGILVGALPLKQEQFSITKLQLKKGDTLFFYTDGVTEAFNAQKEEYQSERLHAALQKLVGANPREVLEGVTKSITEFTKHAPQSDDITMMTIKYYG